MHFTTESGLPSNQVYDVTESSDGTVWVATAGGLAWFTGYQWVPIDTSWIPAGKRPKSFSFDDEGRLIVVMGERCYIGGTGGFETLPLNLVHAAVPFGWDSILVLDNLTLWLYSHRTLKPLTEMNSVLGNVYELQRTSNGRIWASTQNVLFFLEENKWIPKVASDNSPLRFETLSLIENERGYGMVGLSLPLSMRGVWEWDQGCPPSRSSTEQNVSVRTATIGSSNEILAVGRSGTVRFRYQGEWSSVNYFHPAIHDIEKFQFRKNADLWVCTQSGLFLHNASSTRWTYFRHKDVDPRNEVNEILQARDSSLWVANAGGVEVFQKDGTSRRFDRLLGRPLYVTTGLCEDNDGNIWISSGGAFGGAFRWDGVRWTLVSEGTPLGGKRIHKIRKDNLGRLWFLSIWPDSKSEHPDTTLGAVVYDKEEFTERWGEAEGLLDKRVYAFAQSRDGAFWFGTFHGLSRWRNGTWTYWKEREYPGLPLFRVFTIAVDSSGNVWFADRTNGVGFISTNGLAHRFTMFDGLISNEVWEINVDQIGAVWVSTAGGLSRYSNGVWFSFDARSGLLSSALWPVVPIGQKVYVGSQGAGMSILDLSSAAEPRFPTITFESPAIENYRVTQRWNPLAFWGDPSPREISTRYCIDGGTWSNWTTTHNTGIIEMEPGVHIIQVQALGPLGIYDPKGETSSFVIEKPLYLRPLVLFLFFGVIVVGIAFGVVTIARKRTFDAEMRESESKFRAITETTSSAIFIYGQTKILFANPGAESLTGYSQAELLQMKMSDLVHPDEVKRFKESSLATTEHGAAPVHSEFRIRKKFSEDRWVDFTEGRINFFGIPSTVGTAFDISDRKHAEMENIESHARLRSLATELAITEERERRRMASVLHDSIGTSLAMCKMHLGVLQQNKLFSEARDQLNQIRSLLELSIQSSRSLTFELSSPVLHELGLVPAIERLAEDMQLQHRIHVGFSDDGLEKPLSKELQTFLFHAVRELLTNVVKHAQASEVRITAKRIGEEIHIIVDDNGLGQDMEMVKTLQARYSGFGLFNIRERLMSLGGRIVIDSALGEGTRVTLFAPLDLSKKNTFGEDES